MKLCVVTSPGGHLYQAVLLEKWWVQYQRIWVSLESPDVKYFLRNEQVFYGYGPENRNILNFFRNFFFAYFFLKQTKPDIIFSTGAGLAVPFFIWARFFKIKTIFLEAYDFIDELSLTGKIVRSFSTHFLVQHRELCKRYENVKYQGSLI